VINSRLYPSADIGSDHQLLLANIKLKLKASKKDVKIERFDTRRLMDPLVSSEYESEIGTRLVPIIEKIKQKNSEGVEQLWMEMVEAFNETSEAVLGPVKNEPTKEWISTATWRLVEERKTVKTKMKDNVHNRKHYNYLCRKIKKQSKVDKNTYLKKHMCKGRKSTHAKEKQGDLCQCEEDNEQTSSQSEDY